MQIYTTIYSTHPHTHTEALTHTHTHFNEHTIAVQVVWQLSLLPLSSLPHPIEVAAVRRFQEISPAMATLDKTH